ncbi:DUF6647 family protein [Ostreiculturibacter nitratireducens]|uniref:DUF6647 family protein n=1 Tax=Ostreiculturibacter nitratireducens TaxID=3075226 RepID=UPI0031B640F4
MRVKFRRAAAVPLALMLAQAIATPAAAQTPECHVDPQEPPLPAAGTVDPALVRELTLWIGENSQYDVSALITEPPEVNFCHEGEHVHYGKAEFVVEQDMRAAYDPSARSIYLVLPWSAEAPRDRAVLVHELFHWVQLESREWPCYQALEIGAYGIQARYLREHGLTVDWDWFDIYLRARCPTEVHP